MKPRADVVAVVVTFRRQDLLEAFLASVAQQSEPVSHVVIVDNGGDGGGARAASTTELPCTVLERPDNPGPAGGFSHGITHAARAFPGSHLWLFNDDARPLPHALRLQLEATDSLSQWGLVGTAFLADGGYRVAGGRWNNGQVRHATHLKPSDPLHRVDLVIFNGALASADLVRQVQPPCEEFWMMMEEWDYCLRSGRMGFAHYLLPVPLVRHDWGGSAAGTRDYYQTRNHLWMVRNHPTVSEVVGFASRTLKLTLGGWMSRPTRRGRARQRLLGIRHALGGQMGRQQ